MKVIASIVVLLCIAGPATCLLKYLASQAIADVCAGTSGIPFTIAMVILSLCVNNPTSQLIDVMIGNFSLALPCIATGNKVCLEYDILIEGGVNFLKMGRLSAENPKAVTTFNEMGALCNEAYECVHKATTPMEVTSRTCQLLDDLAATIYKYDVASCPLLPNILKALNLLAIIEPNNLRQILSWPNNIQQLLNLGSLLYLILS